PTPHARRGVGAISTASAAINAPPSVSAISVTVVRSRPRPPWAPKAIPASAAARPNASPDSTVSAGSVTSRGIERRVARPTARCLSLTGGEDTVAEGGARACEYAGADQDQEDEQRRRQRVREAGGGDPGPARGDRGTAPEGDGSTAIALRVRDRRPLRR